MNKKYEYFYIGNTSTHTGLFTQLRGKESAPNKVPDGDINMVNELSTNNGISKKGHSLHIFEPPAITVSVNYAQNVFFQEERFCASVNILILKSEWMFLYPEAALYIVTLLSKNNKQYNYQHKISKDKLDDTKILLPILLDTSNNPVIDNEKKYHKDGFIPDFLFMSEKIREMEAEKIREMEAYLVASGLDNFELTEDDNSVLSLSSSGKKQYGEFYIKNLFDIKNAHSILKTEVDFNRKKYPYVTAQEGNNSIMDYVSYKKEFLDKGNCIFIGGKTLTLSYQTNDFFSNDSHNLLLYLKNEYSTNEKVMMFLISALYKSLKPKYSWNNSISYKKIQKDTVILPIKLNDENNAVIDSECKYHKDGYIPDFDYMEKYITAMQKVVIADVVKYKDKMIEKTKEVIEKEKEKI